LPPNKYAFGVIIQCGSKTTSHFLVGCRGLYVLFVDSDASDEVTAKLSDTKIFM